MKLPGQRSGIGGYTRNHRFLFGGTKTAIAIPPHARTNGPAAGACDRAEAGHALGHQDADMSLAFTFQADTMGGNARSDAMHEIGHDAEKLPFVDRASPQFIVDGDMFGYGRGRAEALDVFGAGIDRLFEGVHIGPISKSLDAARRGTGADGDQGRRLLPKIQNPVEILRAGDGPFDEGNIVRAILHVA